MTAAGQVWREAAVQGFDRAPDFRALLGEAAWAELPAAVEILHRVGRGRKAGKRQRSE